MRHNAAKRNQQQNRALCIQGGVREGVAARGSSRDGDRWGRSGVVAAQGERKERRKTRDRSEFDDLAPLINLIRAHPPFDRESELKFTRLARMGDKRAQAQMMFTILS